jgi:hypothetical protein
MTKDNIDESVIFRHVESLVKNGSVTYEEVRLVKHIDNRNAIKLERLKWLKQKREEDVIESFGVKT